MLRAIQHRESYLRIAWRLHLKVAMHTSSAFNSWLIDCTFGGARVYVQCGQRRHKGPSQPRLHDITVCSDVVYVLPVLAASIDQRSPIERASDEDAAATAWPSSKKKIRQGRIEITVSFKPCVLAKHGSVQLALAQGHFGSSRAQVSAQVGQAGTLASQS